MYDVGEPVCGLRFGRIGREDNALAITARSGAVRVRILPRLAKLEANPEGAGPPPEQDVPLAVPKKTKLYVEQTQREREQAGADAQDVPEGPVQASGLYRQGVR